MAVIPLTNNENETIWLNPEEIVKIEQGRRGTSVVYRRGKTSPDCVLESPKEVADRVNNIQDDTPEPAKPETAR